MPPRAAADQLIAATVAMHDEGIPLMRRILPEGEIRLWDHYPEFDRVSPASGARYFYHCHPVEERGDGEHGHFHLFLGKWAMPKGAKPAIAPPRPRKRSVPQVVHLAGLSVDQSGLPIGLFTTNQWVTGEWLYPADMLVTALPRFDLSDADGDPLVNRWLTAVVHLLSKQITALLEERDQLLARQGWDGEDRGVEITSFAPIDLDEIIALL
jgi:hypothetical protein